MARRYGRGGVDMNARVVDVRESSETAAPDRRSTADGLASGYQRTQVTGAATAGVVTTGGDIRFGVLVIPMYQRIKEPPAVIREPPSLEAPYDPATASFSGPLGVPRQHGERAA